VTFAKLRLTFNCLGTWKNVVSGTARLTSSRCKIDVFLPYDFLNTKQNCSV
jgi:hypothetical protein